jgi:hypothetical protein
MAESFGPRGTCSAHLFPQVAAFFTGAQNRLWSRLVDRTPHTTPKLDQNLIEHGAVFRNTRLGRPLLMAVSQQRRVSIMFWAV